jgi:hypothetical protein
LQELGNGKARTQEKQRDRDESGRDESH